MCQVSQIGLRLWDNKLADPHILATKHGEDMGRHEPVGPPTLCAFIRGLACLHQCRSSETEPWQFHRRRNGLDSFRSHAGYGRRNSSKEPAAVRFDMADDAILPFANAAVVGYPKSTAARRWKPAR